MRFGQALARIQAARRLKEFSPRQFVHVASGSGRGQAVRQSFDATKAIQQGIKKNPWIGAIVLMLVKYSSSVPWVVMERENPKEKWEPNEDHDLTILLEYPNPKMSRKFLMGFQMNWLLASGNSLFKKVYGLRNAVDELWPLHPQKTPPVADGKLWVREYEDRSPGGRRIPAEDVIHAMIPDPENPLWGMTPLQSLWDAIETDNEAARFNKSSLENEGVPVGIYSDENLADPEALAEVQVELDKRFSDAARKILAIGAGGKFDSLGRSAVEMDWIEGRKFGLVQFCAGLGVLPALLAPDAATYSNLKIAKAHIWTDGVLPLLDVFEDAFNTSLIGTDPKLRRSTWIHYDTSEIAALRADLGEKMTMLVQGIANGVPLNELIEMLDLPLDSIDGGENPLISAGLIPLRDVVEGGPDPRDADPATL